MLIKKYKQQQNTQEGIDTQLKKYQTKNQTFLKLAQHRKNSFLDKSKATLATLLPLAAASLSPFVLQAQTPCNTTNGSAAINNNGLCSVNASTVDVDGGGIDFIVTPMGGGVGIRVVDGGMTFGGTGGGGAYAYFNAYADGATINSANLTMTPRSGCGSCSGLFCGENFISYGWIDYDATTPGNPASGGGWDGQATGVLGFIKGGRVGFAEISHNDGSNTVSVVEFGIADEASTTSIIAGNCNSLLPVELTKFEGIVKDKTIHLSWETASELNNEGFEVQRSTDGRNFNKITWIEGAGTTSETVNYEFNDKDIKANETYYYRLKQMDYDGQFEYSAVLTLIYTDEGLTTIKDFAPNPVQENHADLKIVSPLAQNANISVFDAMGKVVYEKQTRLIKGLHTIRLDLVNAGSGTHFVRINLENGESQFKKLVIAR